MIFDVTILHCKYVTESLSNLWKTCCFHYQKKPHACFLWHSYFNWLARQCRGSHINSNIFDESTLFSQQKLYTSDKNCKTKQTEHFKSKQQKSSILFNTLFGIHLEGRLNFNFFILQNKSNSNLGSKISYLFILQV